MNVLVIGGAGYIGSHVCAALRKKGFNCIVYDNFSTGHQEAVEGFNIIMGCLGDKDKLKYVFNEFNIHVVMHFAANIEVSESVINPSKYYNNNVIKVINLLDQMVESKIKYFIFSSTAAVYGDKSLIPITEENICNPTNPYGKSKRIVETILEDYHHAYNMNHMIFRYFNAAGASADGIIGESHNPETHLIPLIFKTGKKEREKINIYGADYNTHDGTCVRDYIHVSDIAEAHILGMERLVKSEQSEIFNLGSGNGYSVMEIIQKCESIIGDSINTEIVERRMGDPEVLIADSSKANRLLNWYPAYSLHDIINTAWLWECSRRF